MLSSFNHSLVVRALSVVIPFLLLGCKTTTITESGAEVESEPKPKAKRSTDLQRYEYEQPEMGVPFRIVLYAKSESLAETAAGAAFNRVAQLNAIMSDYETDSELSKLSRSSEEGSPEVPVSEDLWNVLSFAQELSEKSAGAFDITIGPCSALWRQARREQRFPDATRLESARQKVGYQNLVLNKSRRTARLLKYGMRLDLGGIAKGYAADEALKVLRRYKVNRALVAASGDLALGDAPPDVKGWKIEIIGYDQPNSAPSRVILLANCGVSTSGDFYQRLEINGVRYSHIVNPVACIGLTNQALATVIADDCITSDSVATPLTMLEPAEGLRLVNDYNAAARIVRLENGRPILYQNRRFEKVILQLP
jgi:thiamine biosynthesis lipoprotein